MIGLTTLKRTKTFRLVQALSRREQLILAGAGLIFLASLVTLGILYFQTKTHLVAAEGGRFREGSVGQPVFINPTLPGTEADRDLSHIIFSSVNEMAEKIEPSEDNTIWSVRLKEDIFWHDGERLTADDVIFTLEVIQDPEAGSPLLPSFQGVAAERLSELELKFVLQGSYAFFGEDHLKNLRIIPKHIFADIPVQNFKLSAQGLHPIGSGPYEVTANEKDSDGIITKIELKANKNYFGEKPKIDKLIFNFYRNEDALIRAYNLGQIDGFGLTTAEPVADKIKIRHRTYSLRAPRYYAIFINQTLAPEALKKLGVREALSAALDRRRLVNEVFQGHATPLYGPTILTTNPVQDFDPTLLKDLELNLVVPEEEFLIKTAEIVKENWEANGAKVNLQIFSVRDLAEQVLVDNNYELLLFGNITKENQDLFAFWHSSRRFYPDQNLSLYESDEVDGLLEEYRKTADPEERNDLLKETSDTIAEEVPAVFLYAPDYIYIASPQLGGFNEANIISTREDRFNGIENWYVKTRRVFRLPE